MPRYSYESLSSCDFEELVRDLLQAQWKIHLEAFRTGRDQGIDLRYSRPKRRPIIIQCKHFIGSGFATLLSHLKKSELPKIKKLKPERYVIATSVSLSPANKAAIRQALYPFVQDDSDVLGAGDLDGLLSIHPDVVRNNFKLWLNGSEVLDRILHNAQVCHAEFIVEKIQENIPRFVQGSSLARALEMLVKERVVIVSGVPGIGKTTLAEMLLYAFLEQGYRPVAIQAEIAEGGNLFRKDEKQIFYFDDFLGQFFLGDRSEYFGRNQDAALVDFIAMVRRSKNALFILTAREHLLSQALGSSERFSHGRLLDVRYVLELAAYTFADRARILYNHVYFSELPEAYRQEILRDDFFLKIIKHPHFNPRLIQWLSSFVRVRATSPSDYQSFVLNLLANPHELWRHAFNKQLSDPARDALLALYTLGESADLTDLEPAWESLHRLRSTKYNRARSSEGMRPALQELDGAFLSYASSHVSFLNPSIREFVAASIESEKDTASDLLESAIRFKQVVNLYKLAQSKPDGTLRLLLRTNLGRIVNAVVRLRDTPDTRWTRGKFGTVGRSIDLSIAERLEFALEIASLEQSLELNAYAKSCCEKVEESIGGEVNFVSTIHLLKKIENNAWFMQHGGEAEYRSLFVRMLSRLARAGAYDWNRILRFVPVARGCSTGDLSSIEKAWTDYENFGLTEEMDSCSTNEDLESLVDELKSLRVFGVDFSEQIETLKERIREDEESEEALEEGDSPPETAVRTPEKHLTDEDVRQMFHTISDRLSGS